MTKIIAPSYQHNVISQLLLKNKKSILNTQIIPLQAFISEVSSVEEIDYQKSVKIKLKEIKGKLKILGGYLDNPAFLTSIKDFHIDMYLYNIDLDSLALDNLKNKDLKLIMESIYTILPNEILYFNYIKDNIEKISLKDTYISKQNINSNWLKEIVNFLKDHGLQEFKEETLPLKHLDLYYANNKRSEIEASAQLIVENKLNNAQVIVLDKDYLPLVESIYNRYNLNFSIINKIDNNYLSIHLISLVKLLEEKDETSVKTFLSSNPFNIENNKELIILNDLFNFDLSRLLNYKFISLNDSIVHKSNIDYYEKNSEKAVLSIEELKTYLQPALEIESKLRLVEYFFNLLLEQDDSDNLRKIRSSLVKNKEEIEKSEKVWPVLEKILLKDTASSIKLNNIVVVDQNSHYYFNKKDVIILGASANNFLNLNLNSGIIDEKYLKKINYPKKTIRLEQQIKQQKSILVANYMYIFYPLSGYDGKNIEVSFEILNFAKKHGVKAKRYPLAENDASEFKTYTLQPNFANKLFFKNNMLNGSVSSFEQYNNCKYSYFLKSGLKLYPKQLPELSYAYVGSILHSVMEEITNRRIRNKEEITSSDIETIVESLMLPIEALKPFDKKVFLSKQLLIKQISDVIQHAQAIDKDTNFKPIKAEKEFNHTINNKVNIYGFVDRVDKHLDSIRIIDYKSSSHSLSETKFKQGLQLQLLTYLKALSEQYQLKPSGAFFHTLKIERSNIIAGVAKKTKDMFYPTKTEDIEKEFLKNNRINGWHFQSPDNFYFSDNYVGHLQEGKSGLKVYRKPKNYNTVMTILEKIYDDIYDDLKAGDIDCKPIDNPCAFCEYHSICLSKSTKNYKEQVYSKQHLSKEIENEVD